MDHILMYLMILKSGQSAEQMCYTFGFRSRNTFHTTINRIRNVLNETLKERWWKRRYRPTPLDSENYPFIALNFDRSTFITFKPLGSFRESKRMYDGKNCVYGRKKENAVMSSPPHYCLFSARSFVGSVHDYSAHKETYKDYIAYLKKLPSEKTTLRNDGLGFLKNKKCIGK